MTDQQLAARVAALENTVHALLGLLKQNGTIAANEVKMIHASAKDRTRHGIKPADGADMSDAVNEIITRSKNALTGLQRRRQ
jgi:hypothetical protein